MKMDVIIILQKKNKIKTGHKLARQLSIRGDNARRTRARAEARRDGHERGFYFFDCYCHYGCDVLLHMPVNRYCVFFAADVWERSTTGHGPPRIPRAVICHTRTHSFVSFLIRSDADDEIAPSVHNTRETETTEARPGCASWSRSVFRFRILVCKQLHANANGEHSRRGHYSGDQDVRSRPSF